MDLSRSLHVVFTMLVLSSSGNSDNLEMSFDNFSSASGDGLADNLTLSCAERTIAVSDLSLYSAAVTIVVKVFRLLYFIPLLLFGILLNTFVVYLVATHKKLHQLSYGLALQVVVANVILAIAVSLPQTVTTLTGKWVLGSFICSATGFITVLLTLVRAILMLVLATDRFLLVFFPHFYLKQKVKVATSLSILSWVFLVLLWAPTLPGILGCYGFVASANACRTMTCDDKCLVYDSISHTLSALPGTAAPAVLYVALYCKAKCQKEDGNEELVAEPEEHNKDRESTVTFVLLFVTYLAILAPTVGITVVLKQLYPPDEPPPAVYIVQVVVKGILFVYLLTDPIVIMRSWDMREIISGMKSRFIQKYFTNSTN